MVYFLALVNYLPHTELQKVRNPTVIDTTGGLNRFESMGKHVTRVTFLLTLTICDLLPI